MREPEIGEMLDRSFGGVTSAFWRAEDHPLSLISEGAPRRARSPATPRFLPTARPFSSLRAPSSWLIRPRLVHEPAFQTLSDVTTFGASWFGFANQNSTAPAELSRFLGERNGRKPRRITAFWPSGVTYDVISVTKPNSGEFLSESGNGIL